MKQVCSNAPGLWMGVERTSREDCHPWPESEGKAVLLGGGVFREQQTRATSRMNHKAKDKPNKPANREPSLEENDVWPCNLEIERELIGCLLLEGCGYALDTLQARDFHDEFCAFLFSEIREARQQGVPVNSKGTLLQWLTQRGALKRAGQKYPNDTAYHLADMMQSGVVANVKHYCTVLRELRKKRACKRIALDALRLAVKGDVPSQQWRSDVDGLLKDFDRL